MTGGNNTSEQQRSLVRRAVIALPDPIEAKVTEGVIRSAAWWHGVRTLFSAATRADASRVAAAELRLTKASRQALVEAALKEHRAQLRARRRGVVDDRGGS